MNTSRRLVILVFSLLVTLTVGILFWPFILNEIIAPISLAIWVLLRISVLSLDQKYYWMAIVFTLSFYLYYRLLPAPQDTIQDSEFQNQNATMGNVSYWRSLLTSKNQNIEDDKTLKKELTRLLLSLYATKQRTSADFRLYDALRQGEMPLPQRVHTFLFPQEPQKSERSIKTFFQSIRRTPEKWIRRWTGQEAAERNQLIEEVLCFIETTLEMKDDDGKLNPNKH